MVVFLANRANLQTRRLHDRIDSRLATDFTNVRTRRARPRAPGPYRVVAELPTEQFVGEDQRSSGFTRIEVGFRLRADDSFEHYWLNLIAPERDVLVGWHQDDTHTDLGPVHLQVNADGDVGDRVPAVFVDSHPLDVLDRRLHELPDAIDAVYWENGRPTGFDPAADVLD